MQLCIAGLQLDVGALFDTRREEAGWPYQSRSGLQRRLPSTMASVWQHTSQPSLDRQMKGARHSRPFCFSPQGMFPAEQVATHRPWSRYSPSVHLVTARSGGTCTCMHAHMHATEQARRRQCVFRWQSWSSIHETACCTGIGPLWGSSIEGCTANEPQPQ